MARASPYGEFLPFLFHYTRLFLKICFSNSTGMFYKFYKLNIPLQSL